MAGNIVTPRKRLLSGLYDMVSPPRSSTSRAQSSSTSCLLLVKFLDDYPHTVISLTAIFCLHLLLL